eukprot:scaffold5872_cov104-Isochrysis_galbana.AAC.4
MRQRRRNRATAKVPPVSVLAQQPQCVASHQQCAQAGRGSEELVEGDAAESGASRRQVQLARRSLGAIQHHPPSRGWGRTAVLRTFSAAAARPLTSTQPCEHPGSNIRLVSGQIALGGHDAEAVNGCGIRGGAVNGRRRGGAVSGTSVRARASQPGGGDCGGHLGGETDKQRAPRAPAGPRIPRTDVWHDSGISSAEPWLNGNVSATRRSAAVAPEVQMHSQSGAAEPQKCARTSARARSSSALAALAAGPVECGLASTRRVPSLARAASCEATGRAAPA